MLARWQVLRCAPDAFIHPDELADQWEAASVLDAPSTVAGLQSGNPDDFDWWCRTTFTVDEAADVAFAGLTFPAIVFLDRTPVIECESMFLPVRIDCEAGKHEVVIRFGSLNRWLETRRPRGRWRSTMVASPGLRWARTTLLGRAPVYGNTPAPVGIWRPVKVIPARLRTDIVARVEGDILTIAGTTNAKSIHIALFDPAGSLIAEHSVPPTNGAVDIDVAVADPVRWWPNGYGPQHLYRVRVAADGVEMIDQLIGFRTVSVSTDGFQITVNDTPIFSRGVTWSPPDPFRMYAEDEEIRSQVMAFASAGANMVRVVGGLAFEQDEFWQACAEAGLLVWQDAMLATFDPPAEQGELIARELGSVLRRVSGNPALAVVSGGSETLQQPEMLGLSAQESAIEVIDTLLPAVVVEHSDAHYVRSSPSPAPGSAQLAIRPDTGVAGWFGVGGYLRPLADVRSAGIRFAAESLAFSNPPESAHVERHFGSARVAGHHPDWKAGVPRDRGSSWDFEDVRDFYVREIFGEDVLEVRRTSAERYLQLGRLAVAGTMRECFGFWRRSDSGCGGALVLSGRDLVPGAGWGLLDSDGGAKAALAVLARTWAPVSVIVANDGLAGIRIDVHNDTSTPLNGELRLTATNFTGIAVDATCRVAVPPASSVTYFDSEIYGHFRDLSHAFRFGPPSADAVQAVAVFDNARTARDVLVINPRVGQAASAVTAMVSRSSPDNWVLNVTSEVALRYVEVDIPGWTPGDNYFDLAPRLPHQVLLAREGGSERPTGTVDSIDLITRVPVQTCE